MNLPESVSKLFVAKVLNALITFGGTAYFARQLTPDELGVYFLFEASLGLLALLADFGLREGIEKRISEGDTPDLFFTSGAVAKFLPLCITGGFVLVFSSETNDYIGQPVAIFLVIALFIRELALLQIHTLRGELRVGDTAPLVVIKRAAWFLFGGIFLMLGYGPMGLIYSLIIGYSLMTILGWILSSVTLAAPSLDKIASITRYSRFAFISGISGYAFGWIDVLLIGAILTQNSVGFYEVSWKVSTIALLLSRAISTALFPQISSWDASSEYNYISDNLSASVVPILASVIPVSIGGILLAPQILNIVFGEAYTAGVMILQILLFATLLRSLHVLFSRMLQAIGHPEIPAKVGLLAAGVNVLLNLVFITEIGIKGAALATTLSICLSFAINMWYLRKYIEIEIPANEIIWALASGITMAIIVSIGRQAFPIDGFITLSVIIMIGGCGYLGSIMLNPLYRERVVNAMDRYT